ncbi:hypothetical protein [Streptomyces sp. NBC_00576]|uniref:hypothetical protein n=1 Tax=Streptomyces sp. NBC_00576 TaxID=2903665 RepID=UPI002E7FDB53|nr:hypothetical protein [Streptomyces sp. NBC_00576]WUB68753.1 hypothetical protein OG734_00765 [Streptomyces sp. NBC_00576]
MPAELRSSPGYAGVFEHWLVIAAVLVQGVVAAFVTARLYRAHGRPAVLFGLMAVSNLLERAADRNAAA